jgi:hypothetical protein
MAFAQISDAKNSASQKSNEAVAGREPSNLTAFIHNFEEVVGWGLPAGEYTATLACSAKLNTNTHARTSNPLQKRGLSGLSGEVSGGISMQFIRSRAGLVIKS